MFSSELRERSPALRAPAGRRTSLFCALTLSAALASPPVRAQAGAKPARHAQATPKPAAAPASPAPAAAAAAPSTPPDSAARAAAPAPGAAAPAPAASDPGASAASDPDAPVVPLSEALTGTAQEDYAAARLLYEDGDYAGASTKLEAAYTASKDPRLLWNMAACEKELRHYARMIDLLDRYLADGGRLIGDDERQATRDLMSTVEQFVNQLRLDVEPAGAHVLVDGVDVGSVPLTKPLRLDMGKRQLRVEKEGYAPYSREVDLPGGKELELKVALALEVHEGTLRVVADPSAVISIDGHALGTASWTGKLPSGTHSVYVSAAGKQAYQTEIVIRDNDTSALHIALQDEPKNVLLREHESNNMLWWVVGGVALVGAGVGGYFLLRPSDDPKQPDSGTWGRIEVGGP